MQDFSTDKTSRGSCQRFAVPRGLFFAVSLSFLVVFLGCGFSGFLAEPPHQAGADSATPLTVNVVRALLSENVPQTALSFGTLKARRSSRLGFARGGRVSQVLAGVGELVAVGAMIAELDQGEMVNQQEDLDTVLAVLQEELALFEAQSDVSRARRKEEEIAELTTQQKKLTREFQKGFIVAPYRGVIAERNVEVGDAVPAGRPFFRIIEDAPPIVELNVPTQVARKLTVGAQVSVQRNGETLQAQVATKAPELDPSSRTQLLTLSILSNEEFTNWNFGEVVEVQFLIETENDGFWLPYSALQREASGLWSAFVLQAEGDRQIVGRRIVELVQLEDTHALVRGALSAGDQFIVDGLNRVVPGQAVKGKLLRSDYQQSVPPGVGE